MRAVCANCNKEVEVDIHGRCVECESNSIIPETKALIDTHDIVEKLNEIVQHLTDANWKRDAASNAGLFLLVARMHYEQNFSLGQFLENAISMWSLNQGLSTIEKTRDN